MRKMTFLLLICFLLTMARAQDTFPQPNYQDIIEATLTHFPYNTQFALAFVDGEKVMFKGVIKKEKENQWIDNKDSVFEIGSITKVFTSTLLAQMVVDGQIELDDPISEYLDFELKESGKSGHPIRIKHLANHTSGLPAMPANFEEAARENPLNPYRKYTEELMIEYLEKKMELQSAPGKKSSYSNLGAGLLGYILCRKTDQSYEDLLQQYIFDQLDMSWSSANLKKIDRRLVSGLNLFGFPTPNWDFKVLAPAGAIKSCPVDMVKFVQAQLLNPTEAMKLTHKRTFEGEPLDWCLGWAFVQDKWHWHNGGTGGYRSSVALDLDNKTSVILLTNISAGHPKAGEIDNLCFKLMKH